MGDLTNNTPEGTKEISRQIEKIIPDIEKGVFLAIDLADIPSENRDIAEKINKLMQAFSNRSAWYESILDAVPFPITVTDMDTRWTFVNKAVESMLNVQRKDLMGHHCNEWGAGICNTDKCGITRLRAGYSNTKFDQFGGHFNVDCAYVTNACFLHV